MKLFISFLLLCLTLWSADIDSKLYDGNNTVAYYKEVGKLIDQEVPQDQADIERIATQRMILEKLEQMLSFKSKAEALPDALLSNEKTISSDNFISYINALTSTYSIINTLKTEQSVMQSKREYLSKSIKNITQEDKKNLMLYQLQYAFYRLKQKNNNVLIKAYEDLVQKGEDLLQKKLQKVTFNITDIEKKLLTLNTEIPTIEHDSIALNLAKERELMHHETVSKALSEKLLSNHTEMMKALSEKIDQTLMLSLAYLQKNKTQKALELFNSSKSYLVDPLTPELIDHYTSKRAIIELLFRNKAGDVAFALSNVEQSAENLYEYIYNKLTETLFVFNEQKISIMDILKVILILVLGFIIASLYKRKIMSLVIRDKLSYASAKIISNSGYYILVFITLLTALNSLGLDLSNIGLVAGALSIGIGFGLQTVVSNLAAGIILMFERTIRLGDYIEVTDTIRGTVSDMKMRSTTITTNDNIDVIIPNSSFIQNNVINWTLENDIRRIHIPFSVAYGTPNEKVEEVILNELENANINYVSNPPKYTTMVWMTGMGASSVDYELIVWIKGQSTLKPAGTKSDFLKFIYATLNKHHIQIPFPQLDLHIKKSEEDKEKN